MLLKKEKTNKGTALYLAIVILCLASVAFLSLIALSVSQMKVSFTIGNSILAYYGAETGAEEALYEIRKNNSTSSFTGSTADPVVSFDVNISSDASLTTINSVGTYRDVKRSLKLVF